ncbi:MAG TPA: DUF445 domain-containing protein [Clostridia bacterium]
MNDESSKIKKLRDSKRNATILLIVMIGVFIASRCLLGKNMAAAGLSAFSEAAMIGAFADWFAVVALFRHPLGMSFIRHTAIIPENKNQIGEGLSNFIENNFLDDNTIKTKLDDFDFSEMLTEYLCTEKKVIAKYITKSIPKLIVPDDNNSESGGIIKNLLVETVSGVDLPLALAGLLEKLTSYEKYLLLQNVLIKFSARKIDSNRENIINKLKNNDNFLIKAAVMTVAPKILDDLIRYLDESVALQETGTMSELGKIMDDMIVDLINNLKSSDELKEKISNFKDEILGSEKKDEYISSIAQKCNNAIMLYLERNSGNIEEKVENLLDSMVIEGIRSNEPLKEKLNRKFVSIISGIISKYKNEVGRHIKDTIVSWDGKEAADKIELLVGKDLQWIRINGTLVGGAVGLIIFAITTLLHI